MRDAELDPRTDLYAVAVRRPQAQIGVLVVELDHRAVGQPVRDWKVLVERHVAATHRHQCQIGFRARRHLRPHAERGPQPQTPAQRGRAAVQAVVVGQVAAAAQDRADDDACRPPRQFVGDGVEVRAAARGDDHVIRLEQRSQPQHRRPHLGQVVPHGRVSVRRDLVPECRLVPGDPTSRSRSEAAAARATSSTSPAPRHPVRPPAMPTSTQTSTRSAGTCCLSTRPSSVPPRAPSPPSTSGRSPGARPVRRPASAIRLRRPARSPG